MRIKEQLLTRYSAFFRYWREIWIYWEGSQDIYRFRKRIWLRQDGSTVQYSQWIWYIQETS